MTVDEAIGSAIAEIREGAGLSQRALGAAVGIDHSVISLQQSGQRKLRASTMFAMCDACGVTPTHFFRLVSKYRKKRKR